MTKRPNRKLRAALITAGCLLPVIVFFSFFNVAQVYGTSMADTLSPGEWLLYHRITVNIDHDDLLVFRRNQSKVIKRVIGVAGDCIEISDGRIYRNGEELTNHYWKGTAADMPAVVVGDRQLFMLGDNLTDSIDSRSYGCIDRSAVIGKVLGRY